MAKVKNKKQLIIGIVLALIAVAGIVGVILVNTNQTIGTKLSVMLMPETLEYDDDGEQITFYIEENKDYDKSKDEPLNAYSVYYYDENSKDKDKDGKVYLEGGVYYNAEEKAKQSSIYKDKYEETKSKGDLKQEGAFVTLGFLIKAQENATKLKTGISIAVAVYVLVCLAFLIKVWYDSWKRRNYPDEGEDTSDSDNELE